MCVQVCVMYVCECVCYVCVLCMCVMYVCYVCVLCMCVNACVVCVDVHV